MACASDWRSSSDNPLGDAVEVVRREDAERFVEEVRSNDLELASHLPIEEPEIEAGRRKFYSRCSLRQPKVLTLRV